MNTPIRLKAEATGPHREAVEAALREFLTEQFNAEPERSEATRGEPPTRGGDAMQWLTLALAVPGAVLATIDIAQRLKLKQSLQRLIDKIRAAGRQGDGGVLLQLEDLPPIDLTTASASDVLNALSAAAKE